MSEDVKELVRDVDVTIIPQGDPFVLTQGTIVTITHRLGGNFTVTTPQGMFRVAGKDASALGEELASDGDSDANKNHVGPPQEQAIWDNLKLVYDPEIPVNIVDLGLVYSLDIVEKEDGKYGVNVAMTLTAPGCGMGPVIAEDAQTRAVQTPGVSEADVDIVWEPPWNQDMISEAGKMELGLI